MIDEVISNWTEHIYDDINSFHRELRQEYFVFVKPEQEVFKTRLLCIAVTFFFSEFHADLRH